MMTRRMSLEGLGAQAQTVEDHLAARTDALDEGVGQRDGLLVDLLEHEGLVAGLLGRLLVPVDLLGLPVDRRAVQSRQFDAVRPDHDDLPVVGKHHQAGLGHEGRDGGGQEVLPLAQADHERGLLAHGHDHLGLVHGHRAVGEVTLHLPVGSDHGLAQRAVVGPLDEVGDHLGVGLGGEGVAFVLQLGPQGHVVLDDAVEDDGETARAVGVGMGVLVGGPAVRRPAGVGDAHRARVTELLQKPFEMVEVPHRMDQPQTAPLGDGDPGRVVSPVLELTETPEEDVPAGAFPDVPDDTAHQP